MTSNRVLSQFAIAALLVAAIVATAHSQASSEAPVPKPALPNPYRLVPDWPALPASMKGPNGKKWGEVIRVHVAPNGNIWVFQRCFNDKPNGDATCLNRGDANPPILEFNPAGRLLRSFGVGLFAHPHGFTVDQDGNLWTTDTNDQDTILGMPAKDARGVMMGQTVVKISPEGKLLMTLGKPGVGGDGPNVFDRPTGVAIGANGDIFVADGHSRNKSNSARIVKFTKDGKFVKTWGRMGSEPGNFREPHDLYVGGSKGYVYVADRQNNRVQVFDQNGNFITAWKQFGQPSSVYVDKNDNIYIGATYESVAPGETALRPTAGPNDRAIVIGNAITGELKYLIPDPGDLSKMTDTGTSASGIAVDDQGNIYAADVGFNNLRKYARVQEQAQVQRDATGNPIGVLGPVNALGQELKRPPAPTGPPPRLPDGTIDLGDGAWVTVPGGGDSIAGRLSGGGELPLLPAAKALMASTRLTDDPVNWCLPLGVLRTSPYPFRFVQNYTHKKPTHMYILSEWMGSFRQVFLDGRTHPADLEPTWFGHSIGWYENDTLVIDTVGFNDKFWFDRRATPHTAQLHTIERWTRVDAGHLVREVTIDDPGAYSRPFTVTFQATLVQPGDELMEYVCQENNQYGVASGVR